MLIAVLADIHANISAFEAVSAQVRTLAPDCVVVLGDIVGYNAAPSECIALVRAISRHVVIGNHDHDAIHQSIAVGTSNAARQVQQWTRRVIANAEADYLRALPRIVQVEQEFLAVHGCYLNTTHYTGYVTSTMLEANLHAIALRGEARLAFCGHTHVPMAGWLDGDECVERPLREPTSWPRTARAVLINPGAVGQPRDRDPRAAFAVIDSERRTVEVQRVEYDIAAACRRNADADLPEVFAQRLEEGR